VIATTARNRRLPKWSWRYPILLLAFLPILFSAGGCPALANGIDPDTVPLLWFCPLTH
jgi:hypothetical protein